jgi:hypothetical protein
LIQALIDGSASPASVSLNDQSHPILQKSLQQLPGGFKNSGYLPSLDLALPQK